MKNLKSKSNDFKITKQGVNLSAAYSRNQIHSICTHIRSEESVKKVFLSVKIREDCLHDLEADTSPLNKLNNLNYKDVIY